MRLAFPLAYGGLRRTDIPPPFRPNVGATRLLLADAECTKIGHGIRRRICYVNVY
jgi:hypothetical protein